MSGPHGPNDAPGSGEGRNDPTQVWGGQPPPGAAPQWGSQPPSQPPHDPQQAQATQQWGGGDPGGQQWQPQPQQPPQPQPQQWSQPQPQPEQPQPWHDPAQQQWGQQPQSGQWGQPPQQGWGDPNQPQPGQQPWSDPAQQQWGQQPQPQSGQWGQPGQQQWGAQQQPTGGGKKTGLIVGLAILGIVILVGAVAGVLLLTAKDTLDQTALQDGVTTVLRDSYGIEDAQEVRCPASQEVTVDATFTCDLKVGGEDKQVNIKITNDDGTYEVGRPT